MADDSTAGPQALMVVGAAAAVCALPGPWLVAYDDPQPRSGEVTGTWSGWRLAETVIMPSDLVQPLPGWAVLLLVLASIVLVVLSALHVPGRTGGPQVVVRTALTVLALVLTWWRLAGVSGVYDTSGGRPERDLAIGWGFQVWAIGVGLHLLGLLLVSSQVDRRR